MGYPSASGSGWQIPAHQHVFSRAGSHVFFFYLSGWQAGCWIGEGSRRSSNTAVYLRPIIFQGTLSILAILLGIIALAEWLNDKPFFQHIGTGLMVILITVVIANAGIITASAPATPLHDTAFSYVAPLFIFLILLNINRAASKKPASPC